MKTTIHAELPEQLVSEAKLFLKNGNADDLSKLVADALRRYLDSHNVQLTESFLREDVAWGLKGRE